MIQDQKKFRLQWPIFLIAFAIGMLYIYVSNPTPKVILKFPSPYNAGKVVYKDNADECFVYDAQKVKCPLNENIIRKQPIQI